MFYPRNRWDIIIIIIHARKINISKSTIINSCSKSINPISINPDTNLIKVTLNSYYALTRYAIILSINDTFKAVRTSMNYYGFISYSGSVVINPIIRIITCP